MDFEFFFCNQTERKGVNSLENETEIGAKTDWVRTRLVLVFDNITDDTVLSTDAIDDAAENLIWHRARKGMKRAQWAD